MTGKPLATGFCWLLAGMLACADGAAGSERFGNREIQSVFPVKATIRREGDSAAMIVLFSYKRMQSGYVGHGDRPKTFYYSSTRSEIEFDCREHRSRILRTVFFSDRMGRGNMVHQHDAPGHWMHDDDQARKDSLSFVACQSAPDPQ